MNTTHTARTLRVAATAALILSTFTLLIPAQASRMATPAAKSPMYIGQILSLTGPVSLKSGPTVSNQTGAQLALRQINRHGGINGRPLKLILADDQSTNAGGIAALSKLTHIYHVSAIIGPGQSGEILAMTPAIERARIPMIIGGEAPGTTHVGDRWVFRTRPSSVYSARAQATFAVRTLHVSRIALFHDSTVVGEEIGGLQRADLKALGVTPVTEQTFPILASDLTAQVLAIKKSGATGLVSEATQPADYLLLARQMRQVGLHLTWVGNPILASTTIFPGSEILHGTYAATDYVPTQSPEAGALNRSLQATFHLPGTFASAYTYDGIQILARVMRKVGTGPQAIRRGILSIRGYRGAEGTYRFDKHGDGLHQSTIVQNVHGTLRVIKVLSF